MSAMLIGLDHDPRLSSPKRRQQNAPDETDVRITDIFILEIAKVLWRCTADKARKGKKDGGKKQRPHRK